MVVVKINMRLGVALMNAAQSTKSNNVDTDNRSNPSPANQPKINFSPTTSNEMFCMFVIFEAEEDKNLFCYYYSS